MEYWMLVLFYNFVLSFCQDGTEQLGVADTAKEAQEQAMLDDRLVTISYASYASPTSAPLPKTCCTPDNWRAIGKNGMCATTNDLDAKCGVLEISASKDCGAFDGNWCCYTPIGSSPSSTNLCAGNQPLTTTTFVMPATTTTRTTAITTSQTPPTRATSTTAYTPAAVTTTISTATRPVTTVSTTPSTVSSATTTTPATTRPTTSMAYTYPATTAMSPTAAMTTVSSSTRTSMPATTTTSTTRISTMTTATTTKSSPPPMTTMTTGYQTTATSSTTAIPPTTSTPKPTTPATTATTTYAFPPMSMLTTTRTTPRATNPATNPTVPSYGGSSNQAKIEMEQEPSDLSIRLRLVNLLNSGSTDDSAPVDESMLPRDGITACVIRRLFNVKVSAKCETILNDSESKV